MDARALVVRDRLFALDPQHVAANLDVEVFLLDPGQLRHDDEAVAVRKHVQQRKCARTGRAAAEPIAAHHVIHRALQTDQCRERVSDSNDHVCPPEKAENLAPALVWGRRYGDSSLGSSGAAWTAACRNCRSRSRPGPYKRRMTT